MPADLVQAGEAFNPGLPHNRVLATATGAQFTPDWTRANPDYTGLSYAMYHFRIPGFNLNPSLEYAWNVAPPAFGRVYIGLADWGEDHWDWYQGESDGRIDFSSLEQYFDFGGDILVCVLSNGTAACELDWLRIASIPPQAALSASVAYGWAPLTVEFDASGSSDADGSVAEYRWDPEGDGSFDVTTGADPHFEFVYLLRGDKHAAVRVIDNDGMTKDNALNVSVYDTCFNTIGVESLDDEAGGIIARPDGKLLVFGRRHDQLNSTAQATVSLLNANGALDFVRLWSGGTENDRINDAVLGYDGFVYACGATFPVGLVQKWTLDGELLWSKRVSGVPNMAFTRIGIVDGMLVCSGFAVPSGGKISGAVVGLDMEGNVAWSRVITSPMSCDIADLATFSASAIGLSSVRVCGNYAPGIGIPSLALYAAFEPNGTFQACKVLGGDTATYATGIAITGVHLPTTYVLGIHYDGTSSYDAFLSKFGGPTVLLDDPTFVVQTAGLQFMGTGELAAVVKYMNTTADQYGALGLLRFDSALNLVSGTLLDVMPGGSGSPRNICSFAGQGLIVMGTHYGALPAPAPYTPPSSPSTLAWSDFAPSILEPTLSSTTQSVELTDLSGYEFNRGSGTEAFIYMEKN